VELLAKELFHLAYQTLKHLLLICPLPLGNKACQHHRRIT
jgi:hypothetical protein